jgi:hypothetical protein
MLPQRMSHTTGVRGDPFLSAVAEVQLALVRTSAALWVAAFRLMAPPAQPSDPRAKVVSLAAYRRTRAL